MSGSTATTRPPRAVTRANSATAASTSAMCCSTATQYIESNEPLVKGSRHASAAANAARWLCDAVSMRAAATFDTTRSMPTSRICEICRRPMLTSASPSPHPTSRMRFPERGRSVSTRNSVNSSFHQLSRRCLSVGDAKASIVGGVISRTPPARRGRWDGCGAAARGATSDRLRQESTEHHQLGSIAAGRRRQHLPEHPQHRLRDGDRPDRPVEISALVPLALRRSLHARQQPERAEHPHRAGNREIRGLVHLPEPPFPGPDRIGQPGDVQHRKRHHFAPGGRVADPAIERIGTILGKPDDVRGRLAARQPATHAGDASGQQDHRQPCRHARVEPALEQIERQRTRRNEEHEDPDRPVIEPVVQLVAVPDLPLGVELDVARLSIDLDRGVHGSPMIL